MVNYRKKSSPLFGSPVGSNEVLIGDLGDVEVSTALNATQLGSLTGVEEEDGGVEHSNRQLTPVMPVRRAYYYKGGREKGIRHVDKQTAVNVFVRPNAPLFPAQCTSRRM